MSEKTTSSSLKRPALPIRSKSSPPAAYSITIARCIGVSMTYRTNVGIVWSIKTWKPFHWHEKRKGENDQTSLNRTMLGCLKDLWFMISLLTLSSICNTKTWLRKTNAFTNIWNYSVYELHVQACMCPLACFCVWERERELNKMNYQSSFSPKAKLFQTRWCGLTI